MDQQREDIYIYIYVTYGIKFLSILFYSIVFLEETLHWFIEWVNMCYRVNAKTWHGKQHNRPLTY